MRSCKRARGASIWPWGRGRRRRLVRNVPASAAEERRQAPAGAQVHVRRAQVQMHRPRRRRRIGARLVQPPATRSTRRRARACPRRAPPGQPGGGVSSRQIGARVPDATRSGVIHRAPQVHQPHLRAATHQGPAGDPVERDRGLVRDAVRTVGVLVAGSKEMTAPASIVPRTSSVWQMTCGVRGRGRPTNASSGRRPGARPAAAALAVSGSAAEQIVDRDVDAPTRMSGWTTPPVDLGAGPRRRASRCRRAGPASPPTPVPRAPA